VPLVEGSWGFRKDNRSWVAPETEDMWRSLSEVESETVRLAAKFADASGAWAAARDQLLREAFLLQSSDWPFMVLRGKNAGYARERFFGHRARWDHLAELLLRDAPEAALAREAAALFDVDNAFPALSAGALQRSS
jgi:1,4-alpha-glucan branching enzyme